MPRTVLTVILMLAAVLTPRAGAQTDAQLAERFDRAEAASDHARALEAARAVTSRYPESSVWAVNAARMHARLGDPDAALAELTRAADLGYTGINTLEQHADLAVVRDHPGFGPVLERVRANAAQRFEAFRTEALAHRPATFVPPGLPDGARPPLVIALHGTGGHGAQMLEALKRTCERLGAICVAPDALRPAGRGPDAGFAWTYRDEAEWFVTHLIDRAVDEHRADPERVILVGFSQGANIALVMARTHADRLAAIVPICGHYEPNNAPDDDAMSPTYLLTGARDPWKVTYTRAAEDLEAAGTPHRLRIVPAMSHRMPQDVELRRALEWALEAASPSP
tara:strand:+ start:1106 stop:2122 length:1017 start_codon:yes stop_codon:yes gene_type:complete